MLVVALIIEPKIDLSVFTHAARQLTGENPVTKVDMRPGRSPLADCVSIFENFTDVGSPAQIIHIGFIVAGPTYQISQFLALASGLEYIEAKNMGPDGRGVAIVASLEQWRTAILWACSMKQTETIEPAVRKAFNDIQRTLKQRGFGNMFSEYRIMDNNDGTELLRLK